MNNALIAAKMQIEAEDLLSFVKSNPVKRNKSGSLNGNAVSAIAQKFAAKFEGSERNISGYNYAAQVVWATE